MLTRRDFMLSTAAASAVAAPIVARAQVNAPAANAPASNQQQIDPATAAANHRGER